MADDGCHPVLGTDLDADLAAFAEGRLHAAARVVARSDQIREHSAAPDARTSSVPANVPPVMAASVCVRQTSPAAFRPPGARAAARDAGVGPSAPDAPHRAQQPGADQEAALARLEAERMLAAMTPDEVACAASELRAALSPAQLRMFAERARRHGAV